MAERNLDFDSVIERRNTRSLKYDFAAERGMPEDILPMWVADMDFKTSSYIEDALAERIKDGVFGYSDVKTPYFEIVRDWMMRRHGWEPREEWLVKTPGVVTALAMAVKAFTEPGDAVLIQRPVYYPFTEVVEDNGRRVVSNDLYRGGDNRYHIDFEDFEQKIMDNGVKLFLLCSPHNPVGRVWTEEELIRLGDICVKHDVIVVSDEIHADFAFGEKHRVFAGVKKEYEERCVVCTSPSKTFNLATMVLSNIFIPDQDLRKRFRKQLDAAGISQLGVMGLIACETAYSKGEEWYLAMHAYVRGNIAFVKKYVEEHLPGVTMTEHEGTYLVWLNFSGTGLSEPELENMIVHRAKLWFDGGTMFGEGGKGFQRINTACPRRTLQEAMKRLEEALKETCG